MERGDLQQKLQQNCHEVKISHHLASIPDYLLIRLL